MVYFVRSLLSELAVVTVQQRGWPTFCNQINTVYQKNSRKWGTENDRSNSMPRKCRII